MDDVWLRAQIEDGRSFAAISREVRLHPSTVAHHARRLGLSSAHAARHAERGGGDGTTLRALVDEGCTVREIAARLDVCATTVRRWLAAHGLRTVRGQRRDLGAAARAAGEDSYLFVCPTHGPQLFVSRDTGFRCAACRSEAVAARRRRVKAQLVAEAGGACRVCGYDRCAAALQFHHVDPRTKSFSIAQDGATRGLAASRAEAAKCVLLCANCHAEVEAGVTELPSPGRTPDPG